MFISEELVYVELHKTASSHIRNLLKDSFNGSIVGNYNQITLDLLERKSFILGSIRSPFDWWVSLWAYGCQNQGAVFKNTTKTNADHIKSAIRRNTKESWTDAYSAILNRSGKKFRRVYRDVSDKSAFQEWMYMMHSEEFSSLIDHEFGHFQAKKHTSFYTYRFLKMYCTFKGQISSLNQVSTQDQLFDFYRKNCFINFFIRSENLEIELLDAIMNCHLEISDSEKFRISNSPKTNTSSRGGYQKYYNQELINLVQERDLLIIDSFDYSY